MVNRTYTKITKCLISGQIFSDLDKPTDKHAKFSVTILESLTTSGYRVKDSFNSATEIIDLDSITFMVSLDIDSLFANIPFKKHWKFAKNGIKGSSIFSHRRIAFYV